MRVLILGGGGTLGAFSAGALCALHGAGWEPDACIGSSAGSINLLRYLVGGPREPARFWTSLAWKQLLAEGARAGLRKRGLLDAEAFHARVEQGVYWDGVLRDPRPLGFLVVDLNTGCVTVRGNRTEKTAESLRAVARGSYSLPPLLPPVDHQGQVLSDGGLLYNAPLANALSLGATEIVYLCNVQVLPREARHEVGNMHATARYLEIFFRRASNVGFADAHITRGRYRGVPFLTIAPPRSLPFRSLFGWMLPTPRVMHALVRHGEMRAREALERAGELGHLPPSLERHDPTFAHTGVGT